MLDVILEGVQFRAQFTRDVLALARELEIGFEVGQFPRQAFVRRKRLFDPLPRGQDFLGGFGVLPKIRAGDLLLEGFELATLRGDVKENSASLPRAA